jgi:hypothetical protein
METEAQGGCATEEHDAALCLVCQKNILHMNTKNIKEDVVKPKRNII